MTTNISPNISATKNGAPAIIKAWVAVTAANTYTVSTKALGAIAYAANPAAGNTIVLGGTTWTYAAPLTTGNQILLGASLPLTMANAAQTLNASADTNTVKFDYQAGGASINLTAVAVGTAGNALTISATGSGTASGATLVGGAALVTAVVDRDGPFQKTCAALRAAGPYNNAAWVHFHMPLVGGGWNTKAVEIEYGMHASTSSYSGDSEA